MACIAVYPVEVANESRRRKPALTALSGGDEVGTSSSCFFFRSASALANCSAMLLCSLTGEATGAAGETFELVDRYFRSKYSCIGDVGAGMGPKSQLILDISVSCE